MGIAVWPQICGTNFMQPLIDFSPVRRHTGSAVLLMLLLGFGGLNAQAADLFIQTRGSSQELAFARHIASQAQRDPLERSGAVGVLIEASLPELYKSSALIAVRTPAENDTAELHILQIVGDGTVTEEVIDRYLALRRQIDLLPHSQVAITPTNYRFHFDGEVNTGGTTAYVYDIAPRKKRPGLLVGRVWMDSSTGEEVMLSGHLMNGPATGDVVELVRDTKLVNGWAFARITHLAWSIPLLGRAEVVITETLLRPAIVP
jgi:hypothetical protein